MASSWSATPRAVIAGARSASQSALIGGPSSPSRDVLSLAESGQVLAVRGAHAPRPGSVAVDARLANATPGQSKSPWYTKQQPVVARALTSEDHRGGDARRARQGLDAGRV